MTTLTLLVPTVEGRERSLERTMLSYAENSPGVFTQRIVKGYPSIGAAWADTLPTTHTDLAHLTTDDVTAESKWRREIIKEWDDHRGLAVPLVMRMPGMELESHGRHGAMYIHRTQVFWCGVPVVPKCCYQAISTALLTAAPMGDIHYYSDNLTSDVLRMHGHQQIALPSYRLGHWWADGGARSERWATDETNYRNWRTPLDLPPFDAPDHEWAAWRIERDRPVHT